MSRRRDHRSASPVRRRASRSRSRSPVSRRRSSPRRASPDRRRDRPRSPFRSARSPVRSVRSPDRRRQRSPDRGRAKLASPDGRARHSSLDRGDRALSSDHRHPDRKSPDRRQRLPERRQRSPERRQRSPDRRQRSPDRRQRSPERRQRSSERRTSSPERRPKASEITEKNLDDVADDVEANGIPDANGQLNASVDSNVEMSHNIATEVTEKVKRTPISLEEVARKKKEEDDALKRPMFVSKAERRRLAEEAALARLAEKRRAQAATIPQSASRVGTVSNGGASFAVPISRQESGTLKSAEQIAAMEAHKKEIALIKDSYLGKKEKKKKRRTVTSSKSKFMFEWDTAEDTSTDLNPLYNNKHDITLGFGRGYIAGIDRKQQRQVASKVYSEIEEKRNDYFESLKDQKTIILRQEKDLAKSASMAAKNRHWSDKALEEMNTRDWRIFNEDFNISTRGVGLPHPLRSWEEADFPLGISNVLAEIGYKQPTPIQRAAIPIGLISRDVMGIAETGSGKTCAFVLPMIQYILKQPRHLVKAAEGPLALILAPTRELAQQIDDECSKFTSRLGLRNICIVGGASIEAQTFAIREGADIIIATPGRLNDCLRKRFLVLNQCNYIVLDEADRMIDMGFEEQVTSVMDAMPSSNLRPEDDTMVTSDQIYRQTFMFSATMPPEVEKLAKRYLRHPAYVAIGDRSGNASDLVEQRVEFIAEGAKKGRLLKALASTKPPMIVFMNQRTSCDAMSKTLSSSGYRVCVLHGGKVQDQREASLDGFKAGRYDVLVATDVAGRGIDIEGITHVINYDAPKNIEIYTHRIGRTGRAGRKGIATTFLTASDSDIFADLRKMLVDANAPVPHELTQADKDLQRKITKF